MIFFFFDIFHVESESEKWKPSFSKRSYVLVMLLFMKMSWLKLMVTKCRRFLLTLMMILEIKGIHQICQSFPPQNFAFHILIIFCSFGVFLCLLICCRSSTNLQITFPSCSFLWLKQKTKWNIRLVTKTKQHIPSARNKNDQIKPKSRYSRTKI